MPVFSECLGGHVYIAPEKSSTAKPGNDEPQRPRIDTQKVLSYEYTIGLSCMPEQKVYNLNTITS